MSAEGQTPEQMNEHYRTAVKEYREAGARALAASIRFQRIHGGERIYWASVIFLRIVLMSNSISRLLPDIDIPDKNRWWDYASVACLLRTMFESLLFYRYFIEPSEEYEWLAKLNLMQLNDCTERIRLFKETAALGKEAEERLIQKLESNPFFRSLEPKLQKTLLHGYRPSTLTMREIGTKFGLDEQVWSMYQLLSSYTHSFPMSFYRTYEHGRFGLENTIDKAYFTTGLVWITPILESVVIEYERELTEAKTTKKPITLQ